MSLYSKKSQRTKTTGRSKPRASKTKRKKIRERELYFMLNQREKKQKNDERSKESNKMIQKKVGESVRSLFCPQTEAGKNTSIVGGDRPLDCSL